MKIHPEDLVATMYFCWTHYVRTPLLGLRLIAGIDERITCRIPGQASYCHGNRGVAPDIHTILFIIKPLSY